MSGGLSRRLKSAFIAQATIAVLVIVVGTVLAAGIAMDRVTRHYLYGEATQVWKERAIRADAYLPDSDRLKGYLVAHGVTDPTLPAGLEGLAPGIHQVPSLRRHVLVQDGHAGRLYLVYNHVNVARFALWLVLAPVILSVLVVVVTTRMNYRIAKRAVSPVDWLAREVSRWDPNDADTRWLAPSALPSDSGPETRELAGALQRMADRVGAFVRRERDFTRDASHELRTPLTVIRVASDLLVEDPDMPERANRSLQRIRRAGRDMEQVVDAFLILARESGVEPQREDFDVRDVLYEQVEQVRPLLVGKPVELQVTENGSPRLHAAPRVLAVMLDNLLRNACTFTEKGRIDVRLESDRIVIQDTGIGMNAETLSRAYDPFYRAEDNGTGKGMGLSIVRRLGDRFDWPVGIESEPGLGTIATIRFGS